VYGGTPGEQPSKYARTLLILALAQAGLGQADAAAAAGSGALDCGRLAWPTMVLAGKLDRRLAASFPDAAVVGGYRARYTEATAGQSRAEPHLAITQGSPS
jgi:hypothetical protein